MRPTSILLAAACAHGGWSCRSITPASVRRERSCVVLAAPYPAAEDPKFDYRKPPPSKQPPPSRRSVTSPRFPQDAQAEAKERAEAFSDPSRRINQAVRDSSLPLRTELLRTRLPAAHPHGQSAAWAVPELGSCTPRDTADGSEQLETPRARSRAIERPATNASAARASRLQTRRFHRVRPCRRMLRRSLCTPAQWTRSTRSRWWSVRCYTHVHAPADGCASGCARTIALHTMAPLTRCAARPDRWQAGRHAGGGRGGRRRAATECGDRVRPGPREAERRHVSLEP